MLSFLCLFRTHLLRNYCMDLAEILYGDSRYVPDNASRIWVAITSCVRPTELKIFNVVFLCQL